MQTEAVIMHHLPFIMVMRTPAWRWFLHRHLNLLAWLSLFAFILGQLSNWHWFAELFSHFLHHYIDCCFYFGSGGVH